MSPSWDLLKGGALTVLQQFLEELLQTPSQTPFQGVTTYAWARAKKSGTCATTPLSTMPLLSGWPLPTASLNPQSFLSSYKIYGYTDIVLLRGSGPGTKKKRSGQKGHERSKV